jgi:MFS family permease
VCSPISELALVPFAALMAHRTPYTVVILFGLLVMALGGIIYAIAVNVWMVCIGRGLLGAAGSICIPTLHTYIGEMGIVMDDLRKKQRKRPRKFILYIAFSFMMNGGFVVSFALTSIMAQFQDVNPYRWPGWFIAVQSFAFAAATLFFFTETRSFTCRKDSFFKYFAGLKLSVQLGSKCNLQLSYIFMIACGFMIGQVYAVLFTLVTPVLSDQFGFNVECTSHFFVGVSAAFCASSVIQLGAKISRVDNRIILGLCLIFALVGSILVGDWQSIGHDPCSSASLDTASEMHCNGTYSLNSSCYTQLVENCEALSSSGHECFWNPQSEVTGEFCNTCLPVCLGKQKSLNIYQFSLGVLLLALSTLGFVFTSAITSEITAVESQVQETK